MEVQMTATATASATVLRRDALVVFAGLLVVMFLGALDQTIMATALPTIAGDLGGLSELTWVVTVYVLAAAATTPVWGKLSGLLGRRELLRIALAMFLVASALSGLAQGIGELIAFRALQGAAAGGLMTLAMATVGVFVDHLSWRWVFYVNVPIGLAAFGLLGRQPAAAGQWRGARIDVLGAILLAGAVSAGLLVTVWGGDRYAWGSAQVLALVSAAVALAAGFIWQERRAAEPVLPLRLFRDRVFVVVSAGAFLATLSLFAAIVFLPVYLQLVTGATATTSGLLILPMLLASTFSTVVSGRLMTRAGRYKVFPIIGFALMSAGLALLATLDTSGGRGTAMAYLAAFGLGFGLTTQVLIVAVQNAVDRRELGTATASVNLFRALGGSVGVAAYGAVFAAGLRHALPRHLPGPAAGIDAHGIQASPDRIRMLSAAIRDGVAASVADALHGVFLVATPIAVAGLLVVLFLKERPLRKEMS